MGELDKPKHASGRVLQAAEVVGKYLRRRLGAHYSRFQFRSPKLVGGRY
jgi:hypothetical protein